MLVLISIKVKSRIRIHIHVMRISNTGQTQNRPSKNVSQGNSIPMSHSRQVNSSLSKPFNNPNEEKIPTKCHSGIVPEGIASELF